MEIKAGTERGHSFKHRFNTVAQDFLHYGSCRAKNYQSTRVVGSIVQRTVIHLYFKIQTIHLLNV